MKTSFFLFAFAAAILTLGDRAQAMVEYCPAQVWVSPLSHRQPATDYAAYFYAQTPRSVAGTLALHTEHGWSSATFAMVPLRQVDERWQSESAEFTRRDYRSDPVFLHFESPVTLKGAFITDALTSGENILGWDAQGRRACPAEADYDFAYGAQYRSGLKLVTERQLPESIPQNAIVLPLAISSPPGALNCDQPFVRAKTISAQSPNYPDQLRDQDGLYGASYVEVAVSATGALDDAWIFAPSGQPLFDNEALRAARLSKFAPARAFCQDVPGTYLFKAVFSPH